VSKEQWLVKLAGVALRDARLWIALPKQSKAGLTGDVLFTHRGLSGPAAIDLSGDIAQLLPRHNPVPVHMELVAGKGVAYWTEAMDTWRRDDGKKQVAKLLRQQGQLPASLVKVLFSQAQLDDQLTAAQLPGAGKTKLANLLGRLEIPVSRTEGFDSAFVTRGGVKLKEVDPHTLESRLLPGLSLAGELLDLDAPTGGLNLQWAFASGHLAATAI
jgi:predicted Rossmann fold flavoprotein